ncbi:phospho-N-acetylmuramoyl-pentapeptide-transferase [Simkania negevensis]|uniref:Phospho-N-acetylmuramoyl-pentapeptide-transferase n=1 Tax=Simkania negevensis (strain ATCC VR-1471 / DSM 27360 / Z) TaxID=331113 RepID=F8L9R3_SIMNZ|nr:phospho-N-acetylmuramoyl-pentapeptide-transferase [Simkania negevensis]CCB89606.1 phospho-N-acetylmuramoyl-pentapeptide-transferase [Simkania negevensis Z]
MMLMFLQFLVAHFQVKIPAVFWYSSTRMILAAITTLLMTIFLGPWVIRKLYALKTGQSIRVEACPQLAELHQKKKETPTMGGLLILLSMMIALFLWMDLRSSFTLIFLIATVWLGLLGGIDDYLKMKYKNSKGLRARKKFGFQILFSGLLALFLIWTPMSESLHHGSWFSPPISKEQVTEKQETLTSQETYGRYFLPFKKAPFFTLAGGGLILAFFITMFVVTGASNAVNLSDGLDGLASGLILLVGAVLALFAFLSNNIEMARYLNIPYLEGSGEIAVYLCALCGACLGFLWYNGYPAEVFMGDIGSLSLGGILGTAAVLLRREFLLALVGGVFVLEALSVILQVLSYRYRNKKRIFRCAPLHHHFEFKGWPEAKVVVRFWIVGLILALFGLASIKFQ